MSGRGSGVRGAIVCTFYVALALQPRMRVLFRPRLISREAASHGWGVALNRNCDDIVCIAVGKPADGAVFCLRQHGRSDKKLLFEGARFAPTISRDEREALLLALRVYCGQSIDVTAIDVEPGGAMP